MLSDDEIKVYCRRLATLTAARRQSLRLAAMTASRNLDWRLAGSFVLFQLFNLLCIILAVAMSMCLLAFLLAMEGRTTRQLLPWFLVMAVPLWLAVSYWGYSYLILRGVLLPELAKTATRPANDAVTPDAESDHEDIVDKHPGLRRASPL